MSTIRQRLDLLRAKIPAHVTLIAVSKTKSVSLIREAYDAGQRDFGENYVQELIEKQPQLPSDIRWHFIGHLQSNKVKFIAPFVSCIHAVDSHSLLKEIDKQASKENRSIPCLLQIHIAREVSKFGISPADVSAFVQALPQAGYPNAPITGVMGMATFTVDEAIIREEFESLSRIFSNLKETTFAGSPEFSQISMGMSSDWPLAVECGSTMIRVGSSIFGER